ncbi:tetratricopeptide repeat protein [bacterium BMS3Abin05]|nr:tetratricopeptide repeat protein [bacterium BMS3Abin05]GBE26235.1 tetratricopeptide repeat protein [bacterium BMS3Bbin03]HDL78857.1 tetratricopeptide repeat protein [Bacteroidota bacterium]
MLKKLITVLVIASALAGVWYLFLYHPKSVTTRSGAAYQEYLLGKEAVNKLYNNEALTHFKKAVSLDSNFAMACLYLGKLYQMNTAQKNLGEKYLKRAKALAPNVSQRERWIIYLNLAKTQKEQNAYLDSLLQKYDNTIEPHWREAAIAMKKRDFKKAEQEYKRILKINPNYAMAYNMLGYLASQQGHTDEAIEYFKKYIFIAPDEANPHDSLGELLLLIGRYDEAIKEFKEALRIRPELTKEPSFLAEGVHFHLAEAYLSEGRFKKSLDYLAKAERLRSRGDLSVQVTALKAYIFYQSGKYRESLAILAQGKDRAPDLIFLKALNAVKLHRLQLFKSCIQELEAKSYQKEMKSKGAELILDYLRGKEALLDHNYSKAIPLLKQFQKFPKFSLFAIRDLAWAYYKNNEADSADAAIQQALKINPNSADAYFILAKINFDRKRYPEAQKAIEHYLNVYKDRDRETPDSREMTELLNRIRAKKIKNN